MGLCIQTISNTFHFFPSRWFITDFLPQPHRCPFPLYLHSVSLNKLFDFEIKKQIFSIWTQNPLPFFFFLEFLPRRAALFNANNLVLQIVFTTFLWFSCVIAFIPCVIAFHFLCVFGGISLPCCFLPDTQSNEGCPMRECRQLCAPPCCSLPSVFLPRFKFTFKKSMPEEVLFHYMIIPKVQYFKHSK